jgi:flagellar hook-associated protein 2
MEDLGLTSIGPDGTPGATMRQGEDAILLVDGVTVSAESNEIKGVITGVTLKAKATGGAAQSVSVAADTTAMVKQINDFISVYNKAIDEIRTQTRAADENGQNRGILTGEAAFSRLRTSLRDAVLRPTGATTINRLSQIGITADRDGKLTLSDSTKLEDAIANDADGVVALWSGSDGVAQRLTTLLNTYSKSGGVITREKGAAQTRIKSLDTRISQTNQVLARKEESLMNQLAQLQSSIGVLSSQQQYLSGLLSSSDSLFAQ